jgi:hypothetical protein
MPLAEDHPGTRALPPRIQSESVTMIKRARADAPSPWGIAATQYRQCVQAAAQPHE